jgi:hypothetical protein
VFCYGICYLHASLNWYLNADVLIIGASGNCRFTSVTNRYTANGLVVKHRRRLKGLVNEWLPLLHSEAPNVDSLMKFVMGVLASGHRIRSLICLDNFLKEFLTITTAFGISGALMLQILDSIVLLRSYPGR